MADKMSIKECLQAAIGDYNSWVKDLNGQYDYVKDYGELRGVFFNKLRTRLREAGEFHISRTTHKAIRVDDLACVFSKSCLLVNLVIPTGTTYGLRGKLILDLSACTEQMEYDYYSVPAWELPAQKDLTPAMSKLSSITNAIKSYRT